MYVQDVKNYAPDFNIAQGESGVNGYSVQGTESNAALAERLEAQSLNNEPITAEDVKKGDRFFVSFKDGKVNALVEDKVIFDGEENQKL